VCSPIRSYMTLLSRVRTTRCSMLRRRFCLAFSKHSAVISSFGQRFAKTARVPAEFHRYLIEGADSRNTGDYDIGPGLSKAEATKQIKRAKQFLDLAVREIGPLR